MKTLDVLQAFIFREETVQYFEYIFLSFLAKLIGGYR